MWGRLAAVHTCRSLCDCAGSVVAIAPETPVSLSALLGSRCQKVSKSWLDLEGPFDFQFSTFGFYEFPGDHTARVTPVPIPNTEVKPRRADDTARVTVWERRSSPGIKLEKAVLSNQDGLFLFQVSM